MAAAGERKKEGLGMITILRISEVNYSDYDEVWAIVRSLKYGNQKMRHVPELSPSWSLFKTYMDMRKEGRWNEDTFRKVYVPRFLKEMRGREQQMLMGELFNTQKNIALVCFCEDECLCHRSIIGGMLQGAGANVRGLSRDYSFYYEWYKNGVPGAAQEKPKPDGPLVRTMIRELNQNTVNLYSLKDGEALFDDNIPAMAATGRRPKDLCMYDASKYSVFVTDLAELLYNTFYVKKGIRRFISGAAQGFDQMFFWAVERMKKNYGLNDVQNVVFVAFENQESRWAKTGCFSQSEYWLMIKAADMVVVTCEDNSIDSLFVRNHVMCNYSQMILALFPDSSWKTSRGGTSECMRYANKKGKDLIRLGYTVDSTGLHMGELVTE